MNLQQELDIENLPEFIRPFFKAKRDGTLAEYYLDRLNYKKNNYLDDLPEEDIRNLVTLDEQGLFVGDNYKCSGNYIVGLSLSLQGAIDEGVITESRLIEKIAQFRNHDFKFHHGEFTIKQEIDMVNKILAETISYLEIKTKLI